MQYVDVTHSLAHLVLSHGRVLP